MNKYLLECLRKQKQLLESQGYSVAYICIYGSQNYGLEINTEEYQSDIDMKAIIVPTLDELVRNSKPISEVVETEWGQCDVKDIRAYFQTLLKANPAYIETIFTQYYIVDDKFTDEFNQIFSHRDKLLETLSAQFIRSIYGMMCEKEKALCHPYPSIAHKIEKWGWDGKQLHHLYRLMLLMIDYFEKKKPFTECLFPSDIFVSDLIDLKLNKKFTVEEAKEIAINILNKGKEFRDSILEEIDEKHQDYSIKDTFISLSKEVIKNKIIQECKTNDK